MSKNTKIIAIVGGVLIVLGLGYMLFSGGSTLDAIGCGGKKGKKARRTVTKVDLEWDGCKKYGYIPMLKEQQVKKGRNKGEKYWAVVGGKRPEPAGGKEQLKKATCDCLNLWKTKCADASKDKKGKTFKDKNGPLCISKAKELTKKGCGGDDDGGDDDAE